MIRILLPPSETKTPGGDGPPLDLTALGHPRLTPVRRRLLTALTRLARDLPASRAALGLSHRQDDQIAQNARLRRSPTMPAIDRYTGVLYDALAVPTLTPSARRRASETLVLCSALFGALRPDDPIPAYRLSGGNTLPGIGPLTHAWRPILPSEVAGDGLTLDLRSGAYRALAPLPSAVTVHVVNADGRVISHDNKAAKGRLVRALLTPRHTPRTLDDVAAAATAAGLTGHRPHGDDRRLILITPPRDPS